MPGLEDMLNRSMFNKGAGKKKKKPVTFGKGSVKDIEQAFTRKTHTSNNNRINQDWWIPGTGDDVEFDEDG